MQPIAAVGMPSASDGGMQAIDPTLIAKELAAEQNRHVAAISFEDLKTQYASDQSPNKGTEEDYLERKLASGWRRSPDGKGIWCISNAIVSNVPAVNTPDPSCFKNPGPPQVDPNGSPEDVKKHALEHDDLKPHADAKPVKPR